MEANNRGWQNDLITTPCHFRFTFYWKCFNFRVVCVHGVVYFGVGYVFGVDCVLDVDCVLGSDYVLGVCCLLGICYVLGVFYLLGVWSVVGGVWSVCVRGRGDRERGEIGSEGR